MLERKKKWNFEHFANRKSTYGALEDLQRGTISIRKSLFVLQFVRKIKTALTIGDSVGGSQQYT